MSEVIFSIRKFLEISGVKYEKYMDKIRMSHYDYPSILSIKDSFEEFGVDNEVYRYDRGAFGIIGDSPCIVFSFKGEILVVSKYTIVKLTRAVLFIA